MLLCILCIYVINTLAAFPILTIQIYISMYCMVYGQTTPVAIYPGGHKITSFCTVNNGVAHVVFIVKKYEFCVFNSSNNDNMVTM